ncbi:S-adenosylmethionine decarboxylase [Suillus paluster]|uniref:S-adenosylmethionine decarboxylase n=1 Tax=Suillus paluster TaxID=48578 RepID=UPI001B881CBA|nr:S-adenosylmethionine decarboxylase [Suillus paluster]KAG1735085.1 S-adenosylmethionine decarboxylase [Suillus paluster]
MAVGDYHLPYTSTPFEGPEKLLEIWFAPSPVHVPDAHAPKNGRIGLRNVPQQVWEDMLDIVKCKVLSVIEGEEIDAYLLSESSLFVFPHRIILKTCGTTLNLLGLPRILEIAQNFASLPSVYRCFYSRKSFMFPERQLGPHREWKDEVSFLDAIFPNGAAYTVGKVNGDHWLLYLTTPGQTGANGETAPSSPDAFPLPPLQSENEEENETNQTLQHVESETPVTQDYTIEILMSNLSPKAREAFFMAPPVEDAPPENPSVIGRTLSSAIGISDLFPPHLTTLDAYAFTPCGYSSNALLKWGDGVEDGHEGEGYYTIHVTPEAGWSYASFECNVPLSTSSSSSAKDIPDLYTLIRRVVDIFQPGRLSLTLFISNVDNSSAEDDEGETAVEAAQRTFKSALTAQRHVSCSSSDSVTSHRGKQSDRMLYRRTDKISYRFGGYNLAFASFECR